MIVVEKIEEMNLEKRYSDKRVLIRQMETGAEYGEAVDIIPCPYTYEETNTPIDPEEEATTEDYDNSLKDLGVIE